MKKNKTRKKKHTAKANVPLSVQNPIVECAASRYILSVRLKVTTSPSLLLLLLLLLLFFLVSWAIEVVVSFDCNADDDDDVDGDNGGNDSIYLLLLLFKICDKPFNLSRLPKSRLLLILCLIVVN